MSAGCDEDPVSVGEGILPPEDFVDIDTLIVYASESFSFEHPVVTSGSANIFAGESNDLDVQSIFRFTTLLPVQGITPDTVLGSDVFEATLLLKPAYYLGDSTETITLHLHEVLSGWTTTGFNRDVFESLRRGDQALSSGSIMLGDTNAITLPLPRDLIHRWAKQGDQSLIPQGLILKSDESANGIIGFRGAAGENAPELRIIYGTSEEQDTVRFSENARAFASFLKRDLDLQNNITVQAGAATRSIIRFDLSDLPSGALIHNAELSLISDPVQSVTHPAVSDSISAHHIADPNKFILRTADAGYFSKTVIDTVTNITRYRTSVSEIIQAWTTVEDNNGFIIRDNNETLGFHRTSFYTEAAEDQEKRPRLKIIYSRL